MQKLYEVTAVTEAKTHSWSLKNEAGSGGKFVSHTKLLEKLGHRGAQPYKQSCMEKPDRDEWVQENEMARVTMYWYVENYKHTTNSRDYTMSQETRAESAPSSSTLPALEARPGQTFTAAPGPHGESEVSTMQRHMLSYDSLAHFIVVRSNCDP